MKRPSIMLHRYIGIVVGIFLAIIGLTGSVLVFHSEIDSVLYPQVHQVVAQDVPISLQQVADTVKQQYPKEKLRFIAIPRQVSEPYRVVTGSKNEPQNNIYINPYNGEILGVHPENSTLMSIIFKIHTSFLAGDTGVFLVGACGLLLLVRAISGLIIWPGWKKLEAGFKIRWNAPWQLLHYDFHKVIGLFSVGFLILAAVTGTLMTFNQEVRSLGYWFAGTTQPEKPISSPQKNISQLTLDQYLQKAESSLPGGETTFIFPASDKKAAVRIRKRLPGEIHPNGRSFMYLDQYSGEVLRIENIYHAAWVEHLLAWTYPLHIGSYSGLGVKILYLIFGLTPAILMVTGFVIFWMKNYGATGKRKRA
ncbi:MAG: PepSY domain-containing protein [Scytonematopsis contorta HA4267-MV1]|nr:PepSY domain-containing protein [Scytonematopsis contorta HA4267-MV1]